MIKINLTVAKKDFDITNVGGFDFSQMKFKAVLIVMVLMYVPDFVLVPVWEESLNTKNQELTQLQGKLSSLKRKVAQSGTLEKQIRELKAQEENLRKKLTAVREAISEKRNPANLLLYIAKNIPPELWIKDLSIDGDTMIIKGEALNYNSVGNFVNSLRSSVFIKDANVVGTNSMVRADKKRIETFELKFLIGRLDQ